MPDMKQKIAEANKAAAACLTDNDPWWVDVLPAGEVVEGLEDNMILHSGPRHGHAAQARHGQRDAF